MHIPGNGHRGRKRDYILTVLLLIHYDFIKKKELDTCLDEQVVWQHGGLRLTGRRH